MKSRLRVDIELPQNASPTLSILVADELPGFRRVPRAQILVIPLDLLARPERDVAEMIRLGRPAGVLEVGAGRRAVALRVVQPLDPVARRARQRLGRRLESFEFLLGEQLACAEQHPFVADEELRSAAPLGHPAGRLAVALMPDQ